MNQKEKISMGARIGYFFLALAPTVASLIMQIGCSLAVLLVALVVKLAGQGADIGDVDAIMKLYMQLAYDTAPVGVFLYHIMGTAVFGIWYYFSIKKPRPTWKQTVRKMNGKSLLTAVICGICLCFFANGTVAIEYVINPSMVDSYVEMAEVAGLGTNIFVILASVLLAPLGEEFICRGLALKYGEKCFGHFWIANILQALLFGFMHMNWVQGIYAFAIGLVAGWLTEKHGSILPAVILHCIVNLSSSTWVPLVLVNAPMTLPAGLVLTLIPAALTAAVLIWDGKKVNTPAAE